MRPGETASLSRRGCYLAAFSHGTLSCKRNRVDSQRRLLVAGVFKARVAAPLACTPKQCRDNGPHHSLAPQPLQAPLHHPHRLHHNWLSDLPALPGASHSLTRQPLVAKRGDAIMELMSHPAAYSFGVGNKEQPVRYGFRLHNPDAVDAEQPAPSWEKCWNQLSIEARGTFLRIADVRLKKEGPAPKVPVHSFSGKVIDDLAASGLIAVTETGVRVQKRLAQVADKAIAFALRLKEVQRFRPLSRTEVAGLEQIVSGLCYYEGYFPAAQRVFDRSGLSPRFGGQGLYRLVLQPDWVGWVVKTLKDPLAQQLLTAVEKAGGRLTLSALLENWPGQEAAVLKTLAKLQDHLALFEELQPHTLDLEIGFLATVFAGLAQTRPGTERPPLTPCPAPAEVGPEGGLWLTDLRGLLLELASAPARLKQDSWVLFQRELPRFGSCCGPVPGWYATQLSRPGEQRLDEILRWAAYFLLVQKDYRPSETWLELSNLGRHWLTLSLEQQALFLCDRLREPTPEMHSYESYAVEDHTYLGSQAASILSRDQDAWHPRDGQRKRRQPLREALSQTLMALPLGAWFRRADFLAHALFGPHNPLLLGRTGSEVMVYVGQNQVPPFPGALTNAGQLLLDELLNFRLIPLGCVRVGRAEDGTVLLARTARLPAFFGHPVTEAEPEAAQQTRVIVQPDFSIIVIGLDPAPAVELAPFCERGKGQPGQGALQYKLTRESVVRALLAGLTGEEIVGRLQRLSSNPVPGNVLHEVRAWGGWVRQLEAVPVNLFRCPDAETAERLVSALGKRAERLGDTAVAVTEKLTAADSKRLLGQGLFVKISSGAAGKKRKKRSW